MTGIRHFRAGAAAVKRAGESDVIKGWLQSHFFTRARAATRSVNPSLIPINRPVLEAA